MWTYGLRTVNATMHNGVPTLPQDREAGQRLKAFMEPKMGAVQPWAERYGVGRDTIYALWRGREPRPATAARIADALGVSYVDLVRIRAGEPLERPETPESLVKAIEAQTAAIERLVKVLEEREATPPPEAAEVDSSPR